MAGPFGMKGPLPGMSSRSPKGRFCLSLLRSICGDKVPISANPCLLNYCLSVCSVMSIPSDSDESDDDNNSKYVFSNSEGNKYSPNIATQKKPIKKSKLSSMICQVWAYS
jgi:hypothetical protein